MDFRVTCLLLRDIMDRVDMVMVRARPLSTRAVSQRNHKDMAVVFRVEVVHRCRPLPCIRPPIME